jgi:hypothetical protein
MSIFGIIAVIGAFLIIIASASCLAYEVRKNGFDYEDFLEKLVVIGLVAIVIAFLLLMISYLGAR